MPSNLKSKGVIGEIILECSQDISMFSHRRQLMTRILSMLCYGHLKYNQNNYIYSKNTHYGSAKPQDTQIILSSLSDKRILDFDFEFITIKDNLIERLEDLDIKYKDFKVNQLY